MRAFHKQESFPPLSKTYLGYLHWRADATLDAIRERISRAFALPPENMVRISRLSKADDCASQCHNLSIFPWPLQARCIANPAQQAHGMHVVHSMLLADGVTPGLAMSRLRVA